MDNGAARVEKRPCWTSFCCLILVLRTFTMIPFVARLFLAIREARVSQGGTHFQYCGESADASGLI